MLIDVLLYPYGSEKPVEERIENTIDSFEHYLKGPFQDIPLPMNYVLVISDGEQVDYKYQERYDIYGDFLILKHNYKRFIGLTELDKEYIRKNITKLIQIEYPENVKPDLSEYAKHMNYVENTSSQPTLDEIESLINDLPSRRQTEAKENMSDLLEFIKLTSHGLTEDNKQRADSMLRLANIALRVINEMAAENDKEILFPGDLDNEYVTKVHIQSIATEFLADNK